MNTILRPATRPCELRPDLFHSADGERHNSAEYHDRVAEAKILCSYCPVLTACRQLGRELQEIGIWGGETDDERRAAGYPPRGFRDSDIPPACGTAAGARYHRRQGRPACQACLRAETNAGRNHREKRARAAA